MLLELNLGDWLGRGRAFPSLDTCHKFALFYAEIASAGFPDPVTSLIPHHRPDWIAPPGVVYLWFLS